jgi:hypothetical protein
MLHGHICDDLPSVSHRFGQHRSAAKRFPA